VLAILAAYGALYAFSLLFANVLVAMGKTGSLLLVQLAWVVVLVPTIVAGVNIWGLEGAAWAHLVTISCIALPGYLHMVTRSSGSSAKDVVVASLRPLAGALAAGLTAWVVSRTVSQQWLQLGLGGIAGVVVYVLCTRTLILGLLPPVFVSRWVPVRLQRGTVDEAV
jgi:PST family polysaccharide transporter